MAWVSVHQQIRDHRKLRDLYRNLDVSRQEALGILVLIWTWAIDNCDEDGKLLSVTLDDICHAAYWTKGEDRLYSALRDTGWIDELDGEMYLHDWYDFNKPFYDFREKKEKDKLRKRQSNSTGKSTEIPPESRGEFHVSQSPAQPPSQSHKPKPNLTVVDGPQLPTDELLKRLSKQHFDNGFGPIFPKSADTLLHFAEVYTEDWTMQAIEKAGKLGKRNLGYVEGILKGWISDGGPNTGKDKSTGVDAAVDYTMYD